MAAHHQNYADLPLAFREAIEAGPLVRSLGFDPQVAAQWAQNEMNWKSLPKGPGGTQLSAGQKLKEPFSDAVSRLNRHAMLSLNGEQIPNAEKFKRFRLPTNPDLPPAPDTPMPTAATNIGGRGRSN